MDVNGFPNRRLKRHLRPLATRRKLYVHVSLSQWGFSNDILNLLGVREAPSRETRHEELEKGWSTSNVGFGLLEVSYGSSVCLCTGLGCGLGGNHYLLGAVRILPSNIC